MGQQKDAALRHRWRDKQAKWERETWKNNLKGNETNWKNIKKERKGRKRRIRYKNEELNSGNEWESRRIQKRYRNIREENGSKEQQRKEQEYAPRTISGPLAQVASDPQRSHQAERVYKCLVRNKTGNGLGLKLSVCAWRRFRQTG